MDARSDVVTSAARRARRLVDEASAPLTGRRVLALCSGGADSVALVHLLAQLPRGAAPAHIHVLWLNHALRDSQSVAPERAAAVAVAASIDAPFHERRAALDLTAAPGGIEAAARTWRYDVARDVAIDLDCDIVATGHTASDQLEQALLALIGATGRSGDLDAMSVARPLSADTDIALVRPLLTLTRAEIEAVCAAAGLAWAVDPSNADTDAHLRNAIRHAVVPALVEAHPGAGAALVRAGERARTRHQTRDAITDALLDAWAGGEQAAPLDLRSLGALPRAAREALLARWLQRAGLGRAVSSRAIASVERLATQPARAACASVDLAGNACVRRDGYHLSITRAPGPGDPAHDDHA